MKTIDEIRRITRDVINKKEKLILEEKNLEKEKIALKFKDFELQMKDFIADVFNEIEIRANNGLGYAYYMYEIPNPSKKDNEDAEEFVKICTAYFESLGFTVKYDKRYSGFPSKKEVLSGIQFIFSWGIDIVNHKKLTNNINDVIKQLDGDTGNISDGYHTFDELYYHRCVLFSLICNQNDVVAWKSKQHFTGDMYDGMFIVGIETPYGQVTYHYDLKYWDMFNVTELETAPEWDGSSPSDCIERMRIWSSKINK